jgi:hypothetical protein
LTILSIISKISNNTSVKMACLAGCTSTAATEEKGT